ncbi:DUF3465 domain-containing protein [Geminisphaera colitermitum]|uniref:DUF3465 domain-containing protein n=1 Tax=Geminisphaera colitermitum TaxID=1148786 RepID=UPI0009E0AB87|nr:DUF3465 domain-containing protein [Geminisphaera colitermitum]
MPKNTRRWIVLSLFFLWQAAALVHAVEYHGNRNSHVFHAPGCPDFNCRNCTEIFRNYDEAINAGYRPHVPVRNHPGCVTGRPKPTQTSTSTAAAASSSVASASTGALADSDATLRQLFEQKKSDVAVSGKGVVKRLLPDDLEGSRHQRFIIELASGQTLLVAHNIDVAPRVEPLAVGDNIEFHGEYVWSDKGGTIHWTHRDRKGRHPTGFISANGKIFL